MNGLCSACGALNEEPLGGFCYSCGFPLEQVTAEPAEKPLVNRALDVELSGALVPAEANALLEAFAAQFLERQMVVPLEWSLRLQKLATEVEPGRRFATIIFVDLVGYTRLSNVLPEARLLAMRNWFNGVCVAEVERFGGFLIQFLGDAAFAAFGAPWAFERDSEAAIRCLLAIAERVRERGSFDGEPLAVRSGAASGVINVALLNESGRARPDLIGSPVNLAARMQAHAKVFEVVVPKQLADLISPAFEVEVGEPFVPKNYDELVTPCVILGERKDPVERRRHDLGFVGREKELDSALGHLQGVSLENSARVVVIRGEAGIGKTRFARELLRRAVAPERTFHSQLEPHHRHTLLTPFAQVVACLVGSREGASPVEILALIGREFPELSAYSQKALGVLLHEEVSRKELAHLPPQLLRKSVEAAILELLNCSATRAPLALFFDDLQWVDELSFSFFSSLLARLPKGVVVVLVQRPQEEAGRVGLELADSLVLTLGPLESAECFELLSTVLDVELLHPLIRNRLIEESGGVPLYVIELGSGAKEELFLPYSAGQLVEQIIEARTLDKFQRLIEIFQARLDRLEVNQRLTLQCGAILGRRFRESVLGGINEIREHLLEYLAYLKGARFLNDSTLMDDREMSFSPPLLRDIAYGMISLDQRGALHRRFAELLEARFGNRREQFATEIAEHWLKAGDFGAAVRWLRLASQEAIRYGIPQQAYALVNEALRQAPENPTDPLLQARIALLHEQAAIAAYMASDHSTALHHVDAWEQSCRLQKNSIGLFNATYRRALVLLDSKRLDDVAALLKTLLPATPLQEARLQELQAKLAIRRGELEVALQFFQRAAASETTRHLGLAGDLWNNAALCLQRLGRLNEAIEFYRNAKDAYDQYGNPFGQCLVLNNIGILHQHLGDFKLASTVYAESLLLAERSGYLHGISALAANLSYLFYLQQNYPSALEQGARALHFARQIRHPESEVIALINLALANEGLDRFEDSVTKLQSARSLAAEHGYTPLAQEATAELAWVNYRQGNLEMVVSLLSSKQEGISGDVGALWDRLLALATNSPVPNIEETISQSARKRLSHPALRE